MTILSPSNLETADYNAPGFVHIFNKDFELLNKVLLKVLQLQDVVGSYTPDKGVLTWNSTTGKYVLRVYK